MLPESDSRFAPNQKIDFWGTSPPSFRRSFLNESASAVKHSTLPLISFATVMSRRDATDEATQSTLTAVHAVTQALQSRGSNPAAADVADEALSAERPAHRRDSALLNKVNFTNVPGLEFSQRERRKRQTGHIRHHTLEPHSVRCRLQKQRTGNQGGTRRSLPDLLATDFRLHLPTRLFDSRRRGPHSGFLCEDTGG